VEAHLAVHERQGRGPSLAGEFPCAHVIDHRHATHHEAQLGCSAGLEAGQDFQELGLDCGQGVATRRERLRLKGVAAAAQGLELLDRVDVEPEFPAGCAQGQFDREAHHLVERHARQGCGARPPEVCR